MIYFGSDKMLNKEDLIYLKKYLSENKTKYGVNLDLTTLSKIEELLDIVSIQELPSNDKKYNIAFLHEYLSLKGVTVEKFAKYLGISKAHIYRILNGDILINSIHMKKILELFNAKSYEQLQEQVKNDFIRIKDDDIDMNYLKQFLKDNKISNLVFADYLGIKKAHVYRLFKEQLELKPRYKDKINMLLNSDEIVKELITDSKNSRMHSLRSELYDISFLKKYFHDNGISQSVLADYFGVSKQYISLLLNGKEFASEEKINKILEFLNIESFEELVNLVNNDMDQDKKIR